MAIQASLAWMVVGEVVGSLELLGFLKLDVLDHRAPVDTQQRPP